MSDLALVGYGGYGREILDLLEMNPAYEGAEICVYDDTAATRTRIVRSNLAVRFGGGLDALRRTVPTNFIVAIGDSGARERIQTELSDIGHQPVSVVSAMTSISSEAAVGKGSSILFGTLVSSHASLGVGVSVGFGCSVAHDSTIGDWVSLGPMTNICGRAVIGARSVLGAGSIVLPDVQIGSGVVVGAGTVVIRDVPDESKVVGNPGRLL